MKSMAGVVDGMPEDHLQHARNSAPEELSSCVADREAQRWALVVPYMDGLPAMSSSLFELNAALSSTPVDLEEVSKVVRGDVSIAARVLSLICLEREAEEDISRVDDCVVLLGIRRLRDSVLTLPALSSELAVRMQLNALWQHSRATARLSEHIALEFGYAWPAQAFLAGLLHDIGKVPLILSGGKCASSSATLDVEHCLIGAVLAEKWGFPPYLLETIRHHHDPEAAGRHSFLAAVVAAADQFKGERPTKAQLASMDALRRLIATMPSSQFFGYERKRGSLSVSNSRSRYLIQTGG